MILFVGAGTWWFAPSCGSLLSISTYKEVFPLRIVVVGAGKLGYSIAELLSNEQFDVVVVDHNEERLEVVKNNLDVLTVQRGQPDYHERSRYPRCRYPRRLYGCR